MNYFSKVQNTMNVLFTNTLKSNLATCSFKAMDNLISQFVAMVFC